MSVWAIQKAMFAHLAADSGVIAELGDPPRLYDEPPESAPFPYAVLGEARVDDYPGLPGGRAHDLRIQIVSRHQGRKEVKRAVDAVSAALDDADFPIDGARLVNMRFVSADISLRDASGLHTGTLRFRAATEAL